MDKLSKEFPWDRAIVDAMYRILPHFDYVAEEAAKRVRRGELTADQGFEELCIPVFYYISESLKKSA